MNATGSPGSGGAEPPQPHWFDWRIVPIAVATALILWLLVERLSGTASFVEALRGARWRYVAIAVGLVLVNAVVTTYRWKSIVAAMGRVLPVWRGIHAILATWPLCVVTPSRASDLVRAFAIRDLVPSFEGAGSVLAEKAVDVQTLCLLGMVGSAHSRRWDLFTVVASTLALEYAVVAAILFARGRVRRLPILRRRADTIEQLFLAFEALRRRPRYLAAVILASFASWLVALTCVCLLLHSTGSRVTVVETVSRWPIALFIGMIPVTVAGMGTRDAAFLYLLSLGRSEPVAEAPVLAATLGYSAITTWLLTVVGLPFMVHWLSTLRRARGPRA